MATAKANFRRWGCGLAVAALLFPTVANSEPLPRCAPHIEVSSIKVLRAEKNAVLVLSDGRAADLEGIVLPGGRRDRAPAFLAKRSLSVLRMLSTHSYATLALAWPKEDRYGRLRAQVYFRREGGGLWLQAEMLRRGLARVNIAPDRRGCARALLAVEAKARAARAGLWAYPAYQVRPPDTLAGDIGTFQIVEGVVQSVAIHNGRAYLDFGSDWHSDFTATISPDDMKLFRREGIDPAGYARQRVRVRGWIQSRDGPEIEVAAPEEIEVLGTPSTSEAPDAKRPG